MLLILAALWTSVRSTTSKGYAFEHAYYSTDDGTTFFRDTMHIPPFDKNGKQAVMAMVFSCDGGKTQFIGYLLRYTPAGQELLKEDLKRSGQSRADMKGEYEVKKPGPGPWFRAGTPEALQAMAIKPPFVGGPLVPQFAD